MGNVFIVDDHINAKLDANAKIYSHHHCLSNNNPGNIIDIFVIKAKNSTVLGLFQYSLWNIVFSAFSHSVLNFTLAPPKILCGQHILIPYSLDISYNSQAFLYLFYNLQNFLNKHWSVPC